MTSADTPRQDCRNHPHPDLWFSLDLQDRADAIHICHGCPSRLPFLTDALARGERWGIWGGEHMQELRAKQRIALLSLIERETLS